MNQLELDIERILLLENYDVVSNLDALENFEIVEQLDALVEADQ